MTQSQTTGQHKLLQGKDTEDHQSHDSKDTIKAKQPAVSSPGERIANLERTLSAVLQNKENNDINNKQSF